MLKIILPYSILTFPFRRRRDVMIGVVVGHLLMDALTVKGVPVLDENGRHITLMGGKLRTASAGEFILSGIIAFVVFVVMGSFSVDTSKNNYKALYEQGIIDRKEYQENRFKFF